MPESRYTLGRIGAIDVIVAAIRKHAVCAVRYHGCLALANLGYLRDSATSLLEKGALDAAVQVSAA